MRNIKLLFAAAAAAGAIASPAFAASNQITVTANVTDQCTLTVNGGTLDVSATVKSGGITQGNYDIWCTNGYAVKVNTSSANSYVLKGAAANTDQIAYGVYSDATGNTSFANVAYTGTTQTTASNVKFYVKTTAANPKADTYSDVLTFTVAP